VTRDALSGLEARGGAFYLHGDDQFRKEAALRALVEQHVDPATRDFNLDLLRGTEVDAETLASVLATPPMMAEWRVVVVRETEGLASSKHARDVLSKVVADPPPGLALILSCTVPKGSKRSPATMSPAGSWIVPPPSTAWSSRWTRRARWERPSVRIWECWRASSRS
jgi:DNA polymerase-3 subunit delta